MKVTVVISVERYKTLLKKYKSSPPEYGMLRRGIITYQDGEEVAEIPCDLDGAERLLDLARRIHPEADLSTNQIARLHRRF